MPYDIDWRLGNRLEGLRALAGLDSVEAAKDLGPGLLQDDGPHVAVAAVLHEDRLARAAHRDHVIDGNQGRLSGQQEPDGVHGVLLVDEGRPTGHPRPSVDEQVSDDLGVAVCDRRQHGQEVARAQVALAHIREVRALWPEELPVRRAPAPRRAPPASLLSLAAVAVRVVGGASSLGARDAGRLQLDPDGPLPLLPGPSAGQGAGAVAELLGCSRAVPALADGEPIAFVVDLPSVILVTPIDEHVGLAPKGRFAIHLGPAQLRICGVQLFVVEPLQCHNVPGLSTWRLHGSGRPVRPPCHIRECVARAVDGGALLQHEQDG
mmetsp:Transcript_19252/g.52885  ORF Transcript_19252/g.52885 Transcript_19252/m.52885 type:complete len:321 (-) Transcript_19252:77-1039(-)